MVSRIICKLGPAAQPSQGPRLARLPTAQGRLTAPLFSHPGLVSLPARVWFWFFSHGYLFNMENSAVSKGKETCPAGECATFPFYHFLFSLFQNLR